MASSNDHLFGSISGKLGNLVVYQMYGKTVIRTRPSVKRKPAMGKLKESQDDFKVVMEQMKKAQKLIRFGFSNAAKNRSAFHTALSTNLKRYRASTNKELRNWLLLSQGKMAQATGWELVKTTDDVLQIHWSRDEDEKPADTTDRLVLFLLGNLPTATYMEVLSAKRGDRQATINLPPQFTTGGYDCFTAFVPADLFINPKQASISDSLWAGEI